METFGGDVAISARRRPEAPRARPADGVGLKPADASHVAPRSPVPLREISCGHSVPYIGRPAPRFTILFPKGEAAHPQLSRPPSRAFPLHAGFALR